MFRVLGMYNFGRRVNVFEYLGKPAVLPVRVLPLITPLYIFASLINGEKLDLYRNA